MGGPPKWRRFLLPEEKYSGTNRQMVTETKALQRTGNPRQDGSGGSSESGGILTKGMAETETLSEK